VFGDPLDVITASAEPFHRAGRPRYFAPAPSLFLNGLMLRGRGRVEFAAARQARARVSALVPHQ
jgi:hypothetical protein